MAEKELISSPYKEYFSRFKGQVEEESNKYFDELVTKSGINKEKDATLKSEHDKLEEDLKNKTKTNNKAKNKKTLFVVLSVLAIIVAVIFIILEIANFATFAVYLNVIFIILIVLMIGGAICSLVYIFKKLNKAVKDATSKQNEAEQKLKDKEAEMRANMLCLNSLFDYNMQNEVITRAIPILGLDKIFDISRYSYLCDKYKFDQDYEENKSILATQSGEIEGNPFLLYKELEMEMREHTYEGSIVVTVRKRDSKGNSYTTSETLHAYLKKERPEYFNTTRLVYANEAGSNLSFSRGPQLSSHLEDKELDKYVKSKKKELDKLAKEQGGFADGFTPLGNDRFDTLFYAVNRTNEVEFRLLFTPLAQANLVDLINSKEPFGDDFTFIKHGCLNYIVTNHSQNFNYSINPSYFETLDIESSRQKFMYYVGEYFKNIYFDLAPVISIPLMQEHKDINYIYNKDGGYNSNFNRFEQEVVCNSFDYENLLNPETYKDLKLGIIKTSLIKKEEDEDIVNAKCYSYKGVERVTLVPRTASDGSVHNVPVHWIEYFPLEKDNVVKIKNVNKSRSNMNSNINNNSQFKLNIKDYCYKKGLLGVLLNSDENGYNDVNIKDVIK